MTSSEEEMSYIEWRQTVNESNGRKMWVNENDHRVVYENPLDVDSSDSTFLNTPVLGKDLTEGYNPHNGTRYGHCSCQGWRADMEDAHNVVFSLGGADADLFAVYDGHGGAEVSALCAELLPKRVAKNKKYKKGNIAGAVEEEFLKLDEELVRDEFGFGEGPGTTAVMAVVTPDVIVVANTGDSRCVLSRGGKCIAMTDDHLPTNPDEKERINDAGGFVLHSRVMGDLAMSRSIGDIEYKLNSTMPLTSQAVIATPDVKVVDFTDDIEFMVVACDGIYEVFDNDEVVEFVQKELRKTDDLAEICKRLINAVLKGQGRDNMTCILITFDHSFRRSTSTSDDSDSSSTRRRRSKSKKGKAAGKGAGKVAKKAAVGGRGGKGRRRAAALSSSSSSSIIVSSSESSSGSRKGSGSGSGPLPGIRQVGSGRARKQSSSSSSASSASDSDSSSEDKRASARIARNRKTSAKPVKPSGERKGSWKGKGKGGRRDLDSSSDDSWLAENPDFRHQDPLRDADTSSSIEYINPQRKFKKRTAPRKVSRSLKPPPGRGARSARTQKKSSRTRSKKLDNYDLSSMSESEASDSSSDKPQANGRRSGSRKKSSKSGKKKSSSGGKKSRASAKGSKGSAKRSRYKPASRKSSSDDDDDDDDSSDSVSSPTTTTSTSGSGSSSSSAVAVRSKRRVSTFSGSTEDSSGSASVSLSTSDSDSSSS